MTLAELLPEKTIRKLELLKQKQPKQPKEKSTLGKTKIVNVKPEKVTPKGMHEKTRIVEDLARNQRFVKAVWKGQERKVRRLVKEELRRQNIQIRKNFWWVYLEATRAAAMLPVGKSAGRKAAVAG